MLRPCALHPGSRGIRLFPGEWETLSRAGWAVVRSRGCPMGGIGSQPWRMKASPCGTLAVETRYWPFRADGVSTVAWSPASQSIAFGGGLEKMGEVWEL